ncbi:LysR family transcriptional regulator [Comamonas testosteroni]|uniref:LysR family transcriptional regulator n=1 Tax=Comamonas testosteroni TaxID=285 RepID=A0A373FRY9_COMTE|nr:LysR substrate-binding domain-containing protein [Comamonas testosteroni]RGE46931.1 LysR family transcriptional regulator [Comamonas testosteroni]
MNHPLDPPSAQPLPLKSLQVFGAALRHKSFSLAAQELHVTPGAVSQQIQKLEDWLGQSLFVRGVRQIEPTPQAQAYWASIAPALASIQQASDQLRLAQAQEVWLSMPPTLAARWFAPRMAGFLQQWPGVSLHLSATTALADFERERVDLAIRNFDGQSKDLQADLLRADEARLYCAPDYARRMALQSPADVQRCTLLHTTQHPYWADWLARFAGLKGAQAAQIQGMHFDQSMLAVETARHAQGLLLCSVILVEAELESGALQELWPQCRLPLNKGYYLVHPRQTVLRPAAAALKQWLLETAQQQRAAGLANHG